ncbi:hypothetical protein B0J14DRAFT_484099 [Halenospora varia]|nr:hypothetical protein B0J14DRAFT_484099 [Halenospora varia]
MVDQPINGGGAAAAANVAEAGPVEEAQPAVSEEVAKGEEVEIAGVISNGPGPGIVLTNKSGSDCEYFFYDNYWNGNGTAGANFDHPLKSVRLSPGQQTYVDLPTSFKGRVQRGTQLPATWVEFQVSADNDSAAHGDISLQQGCDGAATIAATDGSGRINGFSEEILSGAPGEAFRSKPDGTRALDTTVGNWNGGPNQATIDYLNRVVGQRKAYILGGSGTDDVASSNQCLAVDMY